MRGEPASCPPRPSIARPSIARRAAQALVAAIVPPLCVACRRAAPSGAAVCNGCATALESLPRGQPAAPPGAALAAVWAAYPYEGVARDLVTALKFKGAVAVAREMAARVVARVPPTLLEAAVVVPAPAHPGRRRRRGFDQTALFAAELARLRPLTVCDCLRRAGGAPQSTLRRAERLALPHGTIRCVGAPPLSGAMSGNLSTKVVVLDDVRTTGVTLESCASAIRERYPVGRARRPGDSVEIVGLTFAGTSAHPACDAG